MRGMICRTKYRAGGTAYTGDVMDYYHVGVVTGVEPLAITHCTKGGGVDGVTVDTRQGEWRYAGPCALVTYAADTDSPEGGDTSMETRRATVISQDGNPVKLRSTPSTDQALPGQGACGHSGRGDAGRAGLGAGTAFIRAGWLYDDEVSGV